MTAQVEHGRKVPSYTGGACLHRADFCGAFHQLWVPRCGHPDLLREQRRSYGVVDPVNRVYTVEHRYLQPSLLSALLNLPDCVVPLIYGEGCICNIDDRTNAVRDNSLFQPGRINFRPRSFTVGYHANFELGHLTHLFFKSHPSQQSLDLRGEIRSLLANFERGVKEFLTIQ